MALRLFGLAVLAATTTLLFAGTVVTAQGSPLPDEQHPTVTLTCEGARGSLDAHMHLVGGRGRPARYLVLPPLTCDSDGQPAAIADTIWWGGSLWHAVVLAEADGQSAICEEEGMQLPVTVHCAVGAGAVQLTMSPSSAEPPPPSPATEPPTPVPLP